MKESFVPSDVSTLQKVLVKSPGQERKRVRILSELIDEAGFTEDIIGDHALAEHSVFQQLLQNSGAELIQVDEALNSALQNTFGTREYEIFVKKNFPKLYETFGAHTLVTAEDVTGAGNHYPDSPGEKPYISEPLQWMYYTRDFAVMTPNGVILPWFKAKDRRTETALARFMFQHSNQLRDYPIIFDGEEENAPFQGGDTIVLDENTILLGVENLSSERAAKKIAIATGMNVLGVKMPSGPEASDKRNKYSSRLNMLFLHLDTLFNLADTNKALTIPYVFSDKHAHNPLIDMLDSLTGTITTQKDIERLKRIKQSIVDLGDVTLFEGQTGEKHPLGVKIEDFLASDRNMQFAYVGGNPYTDRRLALHHFTEHVLPEIRFQGGNIVAVEPGHVLMYDHDTCKSAESLRNIGVHVTTFDGHELARWNGGPHCMTCPLERTDEKTTAL